MKKANRKSIVLLLSFGIILIFLAIISFTSLLIKDTTEFNGERAYQDVITQLGYGPRTPDSVGHSLEREFIQSELEKAGWSTALQETTWIGFTIQNIIAFRNEGHPRFILGAHYDTRLLADQDPVYKNQPVPGANDGASGVSVLLEIARSLPSDSPPIWLVFFDAEDNGGIDGREWIMGSRAFVSQLDFIPEAAIIMDMVGDINLDFYYEANSDKVISESIWSVADSLGYGNNFISKTKYSILDDHTAFLENNIAAVDIIDFDYPYWHTSEDTIDKVSARSLQITGNTIIQWIIQQGY